MLLLYLRDFGSNTCAVIGNAGVANHISFNSVTTAGNGIESGTCMSGGTINISSVGYRNLFNTKQMSISFWIRPITAGICMGNEDTSSTNNRGYSVFLYPSVNDLHLSWQNDSNATVCAPVIYGVIKSDDWNHICIVNNNGNVKVYVNNAVVHEETMSTWTKNWSASTSAQLVKCQSGNHIDAVRFYNHALSEEEVSNLYKNPFVILNNPHHLLSDWEAPIQAVNVKEVPMILPKEYQEVEYLQSTGTQYINTGVKWVNGSSLTYEVKLQFTSTTTTTGSGHHRCTISNASGKLKVGYTQSSASALDWNIARVDWGSGNTSSTLTTTNYVNGVQVGTYQTEPYDTNPYLLFACCSWNDSTGVPPYSYDSVKISSCNFCTNGIPVRHFIPCYRKSDNKPGMYDTINNAFYTNAGSGEFILGPIGTNMPICPAGCHPMYFNGTNSYIAIPYTNNFKVNKLLSINVWAYKDNWAEFGSRVERVYSCTEAGGWDLWSTSGVIQTELHTGSYSTCNGPKCSDIPSGWHMFTQTYNYATKAHKFYIDGVLQSSSTTSNTYIQYNTSNYILIGAEAGSGTTPTGAYFRGLVADFRMIAGELTQSEITDLYNGKGAKILNNYVLDAAPTVIYGNTTQQAIKKRGLSCRYTISNVCPIRYIKDSLKGGSTSNASNHWNGIRVYNESGYDLTANATSKLNGTADSTTGLLRTAYASGNWQLDNMSTGADAYQLIDLGSVCYVNRIEVHHYGEDSRRYLNHKLEYSEDGNTWYTLHDSAIHGAYTERPISNGVMTFYPVINKVIFRPDGGVLAKNFIK